MIQGISTMDVIAPVWFVLCWAGYSMFADLDSRHRTSLVGVTSEYRLHWMRQMLKRDNRMMDATLIGNLLRSISFFASTTIFIILAIFTLLKYRDEASGILTNIPYVTPSSPVLWEVKVFTLIAIFIYAFFKYTWSLRLYNYSCVIVGAAPLSTERHEHFEEYAQNSSKVIINAGKHFNRALRANYFGLAALSWFLNDWLFIAMSTLVVGVLYRREFRSLALKYMMNASAFRG
ncbi:MAG: DUF599 domain-containing protein [Pseudomonadota bacterium]